MSFKKSWFNTISNLFFSEIKSESKEVFENGRQTYRKVEDR